MATAYIIGEKQDLEHLKFLPEMSKDANKILQSRGNTNKDTEDATLNPQRQKRQSRARSDGRRQKAVLLIYVSTTGTSKGDEGG